MSYLWYHPESESYIITLRDELPDPLCCNVTGNPEHTKRAQEYFGPDVHIPPQHPEI